MGGRGPRLDIDPHELTAYRQSYRCLAATATTSDPITSATTNQKPSHASTRLK
jgi:hypothetical protein